MTTGRRRPVRKPKGKEGFCWAWKKGHKERGVAAEKRRDREASETHRCHRKPEGETARCYLHGGTAKRQTRWTTHLMVARQGVRDVVCDAVIHLLTFSNDLAHRLKQAHLCVGPLRRRVRGSGAG